MVEYLARYTTTAAMYDAGAFMPDSTPHQDEHRFEASSDERAKEIADEYASTIRQKYFGPNTTLDALLKVEDVNLK